MIRDPIDYNPFLYPDVALERRRIALKRMVDEGKITEDEAAFANEAPLPDTPVQYTPPPDDYFVEEVKRRLLDDERLGDTAIRAHGGGVPGWPRDPHHRRPRRPVAWPRVARNEVLEPFALDADPGAVHRRAGTKPARTPSARWPWRRSSPPPARCGPSSAVPGFSAENQFNLATQGLPPARLVDQDVRAARRCSSRATRPPTRISGPGPVPVQDPRGRGDLRGQQLRRSPRGFTGSITSMTTNSSNCGYVRLGQIAGIDNVVELAGELGLQTRNAQGEVVDLDPSIFSTPLGTQGVTPLDDGRRLRRHRQRRLLQPALLRRAGPRPQRPDGLRAHRTRVAGCSPIETAQLAADILKDNVLGGTGTAARVSGHDIGGKTGTAQDFSNAWFVGLQPPARRPRCGWAPSRATSR